MTNNDIFTQILSEASGKPKAEIDELLTAFKKQFGAANFDKEVPNDGAQQTLRALRKELPGIRAWLEEGRLQAIEHVRKVSAQN